MANIVDLVYLQGLVKGEPEGYKEEAMKQYQQFLTQFEIFQLKPSKEHKEFSALIKFVSQIAPCYPTELQSFPSQLAELLEHNALILEPQLRMTLVRALILLRNRNLLSPTSLLSLFFKLFRCPDKHLRIVLRTHIISDIQKLNRKRQNNELNRTLQNFMYSMLRDSSAQASRESLSVMIELWRKRIWCDAKTVNVISTGVFSQDSKVIAKTLQFFLSRDARFGDDDDEEEIPTTKQIIHKFGLQNHKKTKKRKRLLSTKLAEVRKKRGKMLKLESVDEAQYNFSAVTSIHDPQTYCEKLFNVMKGTNHGFDLKLQMMNFCSRLICANKLMMDGFYSFLQKYAQPHNQNVTRILAILAQSSHYLVSPDILEPVLQHIANTFVTDRRPVEVIAIGLNTIREICLRAPLVMNASLLKDLCMYKRHKDKGVMMASKSIITLFRHVNPGLLPRKERGKDADLTIKPKMFGEQTVLTGVDGADLLEDYNSEDFESLSGSDEEIVMEGSDEEESNGNSWEEVSDSEDMNEDDVQTDDLGEEVSCDTDASHYSLSGSWDEISGSEEDDEEDSEGTEGATSGEEAPELVAIGSEFKKPKLPAKRRSRAESASSREESSTDSSKSSKSSKRRSRTASVSVDESSTDSTASRKGPRADTLKIFTDEDFEKIRKMKARKEEHELATNKKRAQLKRKLEHIEMMGQTDDVDVADIQGAQKRARLDYEARIREIQENKTDTTHFSKYQRERKQHSITNEAKSKTTKPFNMLKHKNADKARMSQKQKKAKKAQHVKKGKSQAMSKHF